MANYKFRLPDIGEGIAEAEIVAWHVRPGDHVEEDAPLADLMTDKATVEMSAPVSGTITALAGEVGDMIQIGTTLAEFEIAADAEVHDGTGETCTVEEVQPQGAPEPAANEVGTSMPSPLVGEGGARSAEPSGRERGASDSGRPSAERSNAEASSLVARSPLPGPPPQGGREKERILASPAVRQRAKELGVDLAQVKPGAEGRIRHADLDAFLSYNAVGGYHPAGATRSDEAIKLVGLRRRIAENMAAAKRHIPHFSYVEEVDVTKLEALRTDLNATRGDRPKLTLLPLLIVAICKAVPEFPMVNARFDDEAGVVTRAGAVHMGMATQTDAGLTVPVIRNAQALNLWQLAAEIARLAAGARGGKLSSAELSGSTMTLTSLGSLGGIAATPVINRPEVAIVGVNRMVERPIVADGQIVIAKMMNLSSSFDHRVVDGWDAASFIQAVKRRLETPALLLVE